MLLTHSTVTLATLLCIAAAAINETAPRPHTDPDYLLPTTIIPSVYKITIQPHLLECDGDKRFTFDGEVFIDINATIATPALVLHSKNLTYSVSQYWHTEAVNPTPIALPTPTTDDVTDKLTFAVSLTAGTKYTIHFKYTGLMEDDMNGFFRSSYKDQNNATKWLGSTQFEAIHARRAFPSFDEPKFKAQFDLTIKRHKSMKSVANTPILSTKRNGDYYVDTYERTPPMSTYLLAFLVSDFNARSDGTYGVVARPEYYEQTAYAFNIGKAILSKYDKYLDLPFYEQGIGKLDNAAIPDFDSTAMENWGLITYKESTFLYDPKSSSLIDKQSIATIVGHEQAHLWFGNLVTCETWGYTWLNEGFATFFQYFMTDKVLENHKLGQQFVIDEMQPVMEIDSTNNTNPMTDENTNSPSDIGRMSNFIAYAKAGAVIRMIRYAMGEDNFQKSMQEYLKNFKYRNAKPNDLLKILEAHWPAATKVHAPLVFKSFTEQVGYPVVTIKVSDNGRSMLVNQVRFLLNFDDGSNATLLYTVPFTFTTNIKTDFDATSPSLYLEASNATKTIEFDQKVDWVIANIQETGYYRVNYDTKNWQAIHRALLSSKWGGIHELNRAQIVDDLFQLARANAVEYDMALTILEYLGTELHYLPWSAAFNGYNFLATRLGTNTKYLGIHIRMQLERAYNQLGFDEKSSDTPLEIFIRAKVLSWACKYGHVDCINQAQSRFRNMKSNPVPANIRSVVYCTAMREGTKADYDTLLSKYKTARVATEQALILSSLGCVKDQSLIEKHFDNIISDHVRRQDKSSALAALYSENNENVSPVFDLVTKNFKELADSMGGYDPVAGVISIIALRFTEKAQVEKLNEFNANHKTKFGASASTLEAAEKMVARNLAWDHERLDAVKLFLERHVQNGASGNGSSIAITIGVASLFCMLWL